MNTVTPNTFNSEKISVPPPFLFEGEGVNCLFHWNSSPCFPASNHVEIAALSATRSKYCAALRPQGPSAENTRYSSERKGSRPHDARDTCECREPGPVAPVK